MADTEHGQFSPQQLRDPKGPEQVVAALDNDVKGSEWALVAQHRHWYECIFHYLGEQYIEWNWRTRRFQVAQDRVYVPRSVTNLIYPKAEIGISLMLDAMPRPKYAPGTTKESDRAAADVANPVMRYRDDAGRVPLKDREAAAWTVVTGNCFMQALEDKANAERIKMPVMEQRVEVIRDKAGQPIPGPDGQPMTEQKEVPVMDPETQQPMTEEVLLSDEGVEVLAPFEVVPDWNAKHPWEMRRYTHFRSREIDYIVRMFGTQYRDKVKPEKGVGVLSWYQAKVMEVVARAAMTGQYGSPMALSGGMVEPHFAADSAILKVRYELPSDRHPRGRMLAAASGVLLYDGPYPYGERLNLYMFRWSLLPGSLYGFGMVRNLIAPQRRLNGLDTGDDLIRKTEGNPQWLIAVGSKFSKSLGTNEPGHEYTFKHRPPNPPPQRLDAASPSPHNKDVRANIKDDMMEISGIHHVMSGVNPPGVDAGVSLDILQERAAKRFQPAVNENREQRKDLYLHRLEIAQQSNAWRFPRPVPVESEDGLRDTKLWHAADFRGNLVVDVEAKPLTAFSEVQQREAAIVGNKIGVVDLQNSQKNRQTMRRLLGLSGFEEQFNLDFRRAQEENERILADQPIERGPYDDDEVHVQVHLMLAKSARWSQMTEAQRRALMRHLDDEHIPRLVPTEVDAGGGQPAGPGQPTEPGKPAGQPSLKGASERSKKPAGQKPGLTPGETAATTEAA